MSEAPKSIRVLLVDDVPELRLLVRLTLEEDPDIEVVGEASNGRDGVDAIGALRPDVVLLDLSMPDMDGLEAIPLMRKRSPESRLVVLSGHEAGRISLEALDQGASRYVNKATGLDTLRGIVHDVAAIEAPYTDERFGIVREMWEAFLHGQVDHVLDKTASDATWRPYIARGREFRTHAERREFLAELLMRGRVVDPRAYGVQPHGGGLVVLGTLEIRGPDGMSETEIFWAFCFRGPVVSLAAGFDQREDALRQVETSCPA